jgi:hypothetical protein
MTCSSGSAVKWRSVRRSCPKRSTAPRTPSRCRGQACLPEGPRGCSRCWPVQQGRAVGGGGQLLPAPPLPGGAAADAGGDRGLEPGRGRRHRHAPRDLLSSRCAATRALQDRSIATGGSCRTEAAAAAPSLQRGEVPCGVEPAKVRGGSVLRGPPRSPPAAPRTDGRRGRAHHPLAALWSHSRTWPSQGQGSTSSSGQRRPQRSERTAREGDPPLRQGMEETEVPL